MVDLRLHSDIRRIAPRMPESSVIIVTALLECISKRVDPTQYELIPLQTVRCRI